MDYDEFVRRKDYQEWLENTAYKKKKEKLKELQQK